MIQQLKTPHFYFIVVAGLLAIALRTGIVPDRGATHDIVYAIVSALAGIAYQMGYRDIPSLPASPPSGDS